MESRQVDLYPRHAGIDEEGEFSLFDSENSPQGVITNLQGTGKFSNARIATLTFTFPRLYAKYREDIRTG